MSVSTLQLIRVRLPRFPVCLFKESTHLIYNESQEISAVFRIKLQPVHGNVESNELTGSVPCSGSVLWFTDAPAEKQGDSSLGCFN